jgi:hypothetical protein
LTIHILKTSREGWQGSQSLEEQGSRRTPWLTARAATGVNMSAARGGRGATHLRSTRF